ncbi:4-coumarate--CoA ligase-like 2 [Halotydeus destructor]|nr:4-coumarate--CoA ligase-like 2 [Halotydeus destructor]
MSEELKYALITDANVLSAKTSSRSETSSPKTSLEEIIVSSLEELADRCLTIDHQSDRRLTALEVKLNSLKIARKLVNLGVQEGDVVFTCCPNSDQHALCVIGILLSGAIFSGRFGTKDNDIIYCATQCEPKIIICEAENFDFIEKIADTLSSVQHIIVLEKVSKKITRLGKVVTRLSDILSEPVDEAIDTVKFQLQRQMKNNMPTTLAYLFTSGSTGKPKGVIKNDDNCNLSSTSVNRQIHRTIQLHCPIASSTGFNQLINNVINGVAMVITKSFDLQQFLDITNRHNIGTSILTPRQLRDLLDVPNLDLYSLTSVVIAGDQLYQKTFDQAVKKLKLLNLIRSYTITEAGAVALATTDMFTKTAGAIVSDINVKVVDGKTGRSLGSDQLGQVWVSGKRVSTTWLNQSDVERIDYVSGDYLRTGDLGYYDCDGLLYILGKEADMIKVDGQLVAPSELENIILSHYLVKDVAIFGVSDFTHGEIPVAYVMVDPETVPDEILHLNILRHVNHQVPEYKKVRCIKHIESIPVLANGKVDRDRLRRMWYLHV